MSQLFPPIIHRVHGLEDRFHDVDEIGEIHFIVIHCLPELKGFGYYLEYHLLDILEGPLVLDDDLDVKL